MLQGYQFEPLSFHQLKLKLKRTLCPLRGRFFLFSLDKYQALKISFNFFVAFSRETHEKTKSEVNTPLDLMKTLQTQISREIHEKIEQMAKRQMISRAAIVRQLLAKAVEKAEGKI